MIDNDKLSKVEFLRNDLSDYYTIKAPCYKDLIDELGEDHWLIKIINDKYSLEKQRKMGFEETLILEKQGKTVIAPAPLEIHVF